MSAQRVVSSVTAQPVTPSAAAVPPAAAATTAVVPTAAATTAAVPVAVGAAAAQAQAHSNADLPSAAIAHEASKPTPTAGKDEDLDSMMAYFGWAHVRDDSYHGTVCFELRYDDGTVACPCVHIGKPLGAAGDGADDPLHAREQSGEVPYVSPGLAPRVHVYRSPEDVPAHHGPVSCRVSTDRSSFVRLYWGTLHPRTAVLTGKAYVAGFRFREISNFLSAFDFTRWNAYYAYRDAVAQVKAERDAAAVTARRHRSAAASAAARAREQELIDFEAAAHAQLMRNAIQTLALLPLGSGGGGGGGAASGAEANAAASAAAAPAGINPERSTSLAAALSTASGVVEAVDGSLSRAPSALWQHVQGSMRSALVFAATPFVGAKAAPRRRQQQPDTTDSAAAAELPPATQAAAIVGAASSHAPMVVGDVQYPSPLTLWSDSNQSRAGRHALARFATPKLRAALLALHSVASDDGTATPASSPVASPTHSAAAAAPATAAAPVVAAPVVAAPAVAAPAVATAPAAAPAPAVTAAKPKAPKSQPQKQPQASTSSSAQPQQPSSAAPAKGKAPRSAAASGSSSAGAAPAKGADSARPAGTPAVAFSALSTAAAPDSSSAAAGASAALGYADDFLTPLHHPHHPAAMLFDAAHAAAASLNRTASAAVERWRQHALLVPAGRAAATASASAGSSSSRSTTAWSPVALSAPVMASASASALPSASAPAPSVLLSAQRLQRSLLAPQQRYSANICAPAARALELLLHDAKFQRARDAHKRVVGRLGDALASQTHPAFDS